MKGTAVFFIFLIFGQLYCQHQTQTSEANAIAIFKDIYSGFMSGLGLAPDFGVVGCFKSVSAIINFFKSHISKKRNFKNPVEVKAFTNGIQNFVNSQQDQVWNCFRAKGNVQKLLAIFGLRVLNIWVFVGLLVKNLALHYNQFIQYIGKMAENWELARFKNWGFYAGKIAEIILKP